MSTLNPYSFSPGKTQVYAKYVGHVIDYEYFLFVDQDDNLLWIKDDFKAPRFSYLGCYSLHFREPMFIKSRQYDTFNVFAMEYRDLKGYQLQVSAVDISKSQHFSIAEEISTIGAGEEVLKFA